jgi:hypothetical protein
MAWNSWCEALASLNQRRTSKTLRLPQWHGAPCSAPGTSPRSISAGISAGALDIDGNEAVGGIVVMRTGENAKAVIASSESTDRGDCAKPSAWNPY